MPLTMRSGLFMAFLVAVLAMAPVAPEAGNVLVLVTGGLAILPLMRSGASGFGRPVVWMTLLGLLLIAIAYVLGARSADGLIGLAYFAPVFVVWPLLVAGNESDDDLLPWLVGLLGLCGAAGTAVVALGEVASGTFRAGGTVANPIHFADVALLMGFASTAGLLAKAGRWRLIFILGPILALTAVVLSGTRGAIVAGAAMFAFAGLAVAVLRLVSLRTVALGVIGLVAVVALGLVFNADQISGIQRVMADVADVVRVGIPTDESTAIRLQMVLGGWRAFLEAPLFGHGPLAFVDAAQRLSHIPHTTVPHLHNDIIDFAASGGVVGLVAYCLFLFAPIVEALRAPTAPGKKPVIVLAGTLMLGFFIMGLTNAMFGILTVTTCYAAICVIIGRLARPQSLTQPVPPAISRA